MHKNPNMFWTLLARGMYTFFDHLKWTPVIAVGYAASIATHFWINAQLF